nr:immunoglobulin light chain junction region [Macaca mulatta]
DYYCSSYAGTILF